MKSFDNKGFLRILIIALILVFGGVVLVYILDGSNIKERIWRSSEKDSESIEINNNKLKSNSNYKLDLNDKGVLNLDEIEKIEINCVSTDIKIKTTTEEESKVQFKGAYFGNEDGAPTLEISKNGKIATIEVKYPEHIKFESITLATTLEVEIPEIYNKKIQINTVSSGLDIEEIKVEELKLDTVSGDVTIDSLYGKLNAQTVSGDVKVNFEELQDDISFSTTSGELSIKVPDDSNFTFSLNTVSGEVNSELPISFNNNSKTRIEGKIGNGQNSINCNSISGDINIDN